jgi:hypothetical protein
MKVMHSGSRRYYGIFVGYYEARTQLAVVANAKIKPKKKPQKETDKKLRDL